MTTGKPSIQGAHNAADNHPLGVPSGSTDSETVLRLGRVASMAGMPGERLAALSGVVAVALMAAHFIVGEARGDPTQPSRVVASAMAASRSAARTATYLGLGGVFLLLWFVGFRLAHRRCALTQLVRTLRAGQRTPRRTELGSWRGAG